MNSTKGLTIGDWLADVSGVPKQVQEVYDDAITLGGVLNHVSTVVPIPLTIQILETNRFRKSKECDYIFGTDDYDVVIDLFDPSPNARLHDKEDYDKEVGVRLQQSDYLFGPIDAAIVIRANYVHELQHALQLCGIDKSIIL